MKLPKTQRTRDLSTFDKEATKTHLQTNYFQALTNKLQAVGKESSPTEKVLFRICLMVWQLVVFRRDQSKKPSCIFPHLPVHIFTFLILVLENDKLSV